MQLVQKKLRFLQYMQLKHLSFDSNLFGYPVMAFSATQLSLAELNEIQAIAEGNTRLVYIFLEQPIAFVNKKQNFLFVDEKVIFQQELDNTNFEEKSIESYTKKTISNTLYDLALASGHSSRFNIDPHFTNNEFEQLYHLWIEQSIEGEIADVTWVHYNDAKESGLLTLRKKSEFTEIGLLAVANEVRGLGIGRKLIDKAKWQSKEWGFKQLKVATQKRNEGAFQFYERNGFLVDQLIYVYHLWI